MTIYWAKPPHRNWRAVTSLMSTALRGLIGELTTYASVIETAADDPQAVRAARQRVRTAAERFSDASREETGWGSPFSADDAGDPERRPPTEGDRENMFEVSGTYVVAVPDPYSLSEVADHRTTVAGRGRCEYDDLSDPVDSLRALYVADGWDPFQYGGEIVQVLRASSSVARVPDSSGRHPHSNRHAKRHSSRSPRT